MNSSALYRRARTHGTVRRAVARGTVALAAGLFVWLNTGTGLTQNKTPYDKERLLRVVRLNALSTAEIIRAVEQRGVNFLVTPEIETEFRAAGARPELIDTLRNNYRPTAPAGNTTNTGGAPTSTGNSGEGTTTPARVPSGSPLGKNEIISMLQAGVASARVEQFVEARGVSFELNQEITHEIIAAGGSRSLIGAISEKSVASSKSPAGSTGDYSGIGATLEERTVGGQTYNFVTATAQGSPAARAGLRRGDRLLAVDGQSTAGKHAKEIASMVRGETGSVATITFERAGQTETLRITREAVTQASFPTGPDYDDLTDQAVYAMQTNNAVYGVQLLQQAIRLDPSRPTAYQLLGFAQLYGAFDIASAEQSMRAAMERGGSAVFYVYHDHGAGNFTSGYCEGSFFVTKSGVSYKAKDGNHTFEADKANIKEAKTNSLMGAGYGVFHIKVTQADGKSKNYNFMPATKNAAESNLLIRLIRAY